MTRRDRDNVPRWLNRLVVFITAILATIVVLAGASIVHGDEAPVEVQTRGGCHGGPAYCPPVTTEPPATTDPTIATTAPPASTAPATTATVATTVPPVETTEPAPTTVPAVTTEPTATTVPTVETTEPTVSVAPPPVPSTDPEGCPADPQGRQLRSDCTPDPCVIRTGPTTGYMSPNYVPGHVPGGDQGTTAGYVVDCTVPTTPPTTVTPQLPTTGGNGATLSIVAIGLLAAGTALVAASRRSPA